MSRSLNILAFARESGGAQAVAPVCHAMRKKGWNVLLLAKDYGLSVFQKHRLDCIDFSLFDTDRLCALSRERFNGVPDIIFTSATSLPALDMTERYLWRWGRENGIPTAGILDQWQNYALRFSGPDARETLAYMPDRIFAMDDLALSEMVKEGIPGERIVITGQPALDSILDEHRECLLKANALKGALAIEKRFTIVTFVAESLKKDFAKSLGYDEFSTLEYLGDVLDAEAAKKNGPKICLIVKLHPENRFEEFERYVSRWSHLEKRFIAKELNPREVIAISDIVIGMTSIMLVESIFADRPTVSLQLGSRTGSQLVATKTGAIPFIRTRRHAKMVVGRLLRDAISRRRYVQNQKLWKIEKRATEKCVEALSRMGKR